MAVTVDKVITELELKDGEFNARVRANEAEFTRSQQKAAAEATKAARQIEATMGQIPDSLRKKYRQLGEDIGRSFQAGSRAAQLAFGAIVAYSLNAARKAEDVNDAFAFTFNAIGDDAEKAASRIATTFDRTTTQVKESLSNAYQILTGVGLSSAEAFRASQIIAERSIDLASQKGISDARAYQAIISGITGETEPLKSVGVVLNEAAVKAELLRLGFKGNAEQASEAAKSAARLNLILKGTQTAQGDVARTADSANNKLKAAKTQFENAAVALGNELLPSLIKVTGAATDMLKAFNDLPGGVQVAALSFLGIIAAGGPIAGLIANLLRLRAVAIETRLALAAVGGGAAGGAAAGGAARGLLAGGVAAAAGVGGGLLLSQGSFVRQPTRTEAIVQSNLDNTRRLRPNDTRSIRGLEAELAQIRRRQDLADLANGTGRYAPGTSSNGNNLGGFSLTRPGGGNNVIGGFGLGGLPNGGRIAGGGGVSGGGRGGTTAISDEAKKLDDLRRDLASIQDDLLTDAERAAKELAEKVATIREAVAKDLATPQEAAVLEGGVAAQDLKIAPAQDIQPLALEFGGYIAEGFKQRAVFDEQGANAARGFIDIVRSGNIGEAIGERFKQAAFDGLEAQLGKLFSALFASSSGGGGTGNGGGFGSFIASAVQTIFGGKRASGGPVTPGKIYRVNENTPNSELFTPSVPGYISPNASMDVKAERPAPMVNSFTFAPAYNVQGYGEDIRRLERQMEQDRRGFRQNVAAAVNDGRQRNRIR